MYRTMKGIVWLSLMAVLALGAPASVAGQTTLGVGAQASTLGLGGMAAIGFGDQVTLRASGGVFPFDVEIEASDIDFDIELPSPQFLATLDWYPGGGGFHLSGGLMFSSEDFEVAAAPNEPVEVGDRTYSPADVGRLFGTLENDDVAPYLGIGFGNPAGSGKRVGVFLDLGVAFQGEPVVTLDAEDGTLADDPTFRDDLAREERNFEDDVSVFRYYPMITFGLSLRLL